MSIVFHYDDSPLPIGLAMGMNSNRESYLLGLYDGADYGDQYIDEPDNGVLFEGPEGARAWLDAVTAVLEPYIHRADTSTRTPVRDGWGGGD